MLETPVHLYHIAYSTPTLEQAPPSYLILDNLKNERPDWFEYWPIRRFLLETSLDEEAFYGFFSPKFFAKTGQTHQDVVEFVRQHGRDSDICLFSPQPDIGAFFLNVFEGGELFNPGKIEVCEAFLRSIGITLDLRSLVMDSRQIVFSNFFVARPAFWRRWLELNEQLFAACEDPHHSLHQQLTQPTSYPKAQRKVFIMEGMASLLLTMEPRWRTKSANTFQFAWSGTNLSRFRQEAIISDALKMAYRDQGFQEYMDCFASIRARIG
ncbi:MAG: hypothetical protein RJA36_2157 [Pseudomonadota bacterium]|jgi:hypothetical protein